MPLILKIEGAFFIRAFVANLFSSILWVKKVATNARMNSQFYGLFVF
jgi:hypothetical protein